MEIGLLRQILKKNKQWSRLADEVAMLPEKPKPARVLSPEEKRVLLETAALRPDWQSYSLCSCLGAQYDNAGLRVERAALEGY